MKHVAARYASALSCSERSSPKVSQIIPVTIESTIELVISCVRAIAGARVSISRHKGRSL
eukprot:COSAG05_NODE_63_length_22889_cov_41.986617_4_plen_60_part_00